MIIGAYSAKVETGFAIRIRAFLAKAFSGGEPASTSPENAQTGIHFSGSCSGGSGGGELHDLLDLGLRAVELLQQGLGKQPHAERQMAVRRDQADRGMM